MYPQGRVWSQCVLKQFGHFPNSVIFNFEEDFIEDEFSTEYPDDPSPCDDDEEAGEAV
jgi:hypothetical protein